ncbi:MAG: D-2-hydroxyacid dehydrogenase [Fusicatenibacter sp.]|nr:D-2-hydroxyacid dehydrogenase [Fusicatenibacter sp.]
MKIVILEADSLGSDMDLSGFSRFGEVVIYPTTKEEECPSRVADADVVICNKVRMCARTLQGAEKLKLICVTATGTNNIDAGYVKKHQIAVTNVAGYSTNSVAQHTFAMYFYLAEKLRYYDDYVKDGSYAESSLFTCFGEPFQEMEGKTWGIIGLGAIGRKVASIARSFGCRVIYYSTSGKHDDPEFERVSFGKLLKDADIISIHSPLTPETENLITLETFANMKRTAILINVGRGGIVNEQDLCIALNEGLIAGAALDVLSQEPMKADNPLLSIKDSRKLYITPHIAWASVEARTRLVRMVQKNLESYLSGGDLNRVY